jgi:hypothetical protein
MKEITMKKILTLTTAALIGLSVAGAAPALAHKRHGHFHGHSLKFGFGFGHKVKLCYFNHYYGHVVCTWRWVGY